MGLEDLFGLIGDFPGEALGEASRSGLSGVADALTSSGVDLSGAGEQFGADLAGGAAVGTGALGDVAKATSGGDWASRLWGGAGDVAGKAWGGAKDAGGGFGAFAKGALPFAQLGAAGLGVANSLKAQDLAAQNAKRIKESFALQERAAVPLTNFGETQLKNAQAGNVPTAVQAQIDQWAQGAKVKARDYLARAGIADSSAAAQWDAYIDQQAQAMKAQALTAESQQGIDALGKGANVAAGAGNQAGQQQTSLEQLIAAANAQLGRLSGAAA